MHRFFVNHKKEKKGEDVSLDSLRHQLKNVLRFRKDDFIEIFDDTSFEYSIRILDDNCDFGEIISKRIRKIEMYPEIILCQSFIKNDRFELILEKSSELGVTQIIPMITERVQSGSKLKNFDSKHSRWRKIIQEAVEQSGGNVIPTIESFHTFKDLLNLFDDQYEKILFWEKFENFDVNNDRRISLTEFRTMSNTLFDAQLSEKESVYYFELIDTNSKGMILFNEFCAFMIKRKIALQ